MFGFRRRGRQEQLRVGRRFVPPLPPDSRFSLEVSTANGSTAHKIDPAPPMAGKMDDNVSQTQADPVKHREIERKGVQKSVSGVQLPASQVSVKSVRLMGRGEEEEEGSKNLQVELHPIADAVVFQRQSILEGSFTLPLQENLVGLSTDSSSDLSFEEACENVSDRTQRKMGQLDNKQHHAPTGSEAKQGMAALVPSLSLTLMTIIGSPDGALVAMLFFCL